MSRIVSSISDNTLVLPPERVLQSRTMSLQNDTLESLEDGEFLSSSDAFTDQGEGDKQPQERKSSGRRMRKSKARTKGRTHSLQHLKQRVSALLTLYEQNGLYIPTPDMPKGKVWSNRNYGADKKSQRKNAERSMLEPRIAQLEEGLLAKGIELPD
eukprot:g54337.t1